MIQLRAIDLPHDYSLLAGWWERHEQPVVPAPVLPRLGLLAVDAGIPIAAVWLFMANCKGVCFLCFWVTRPGAQPRRVQAAIQALTRQMETVARENHYGLMLAMAPEQGGLRQTLARLEFSAGATPAHLLMMKRLTLPAPAPAPAPTPATARTTTLVVAPTAAVAVMEPTDATAMTATMSATTTTPPDVGAVLAVAVAA